jgi:adenylosuccinate synthase
MPVTAVIGAQWGDEAKGKIVDYLADSNQIVARFNGGDNAGHTVVNPYGTFKLRLVPNGFSTPGAVCVIGPGVVLNLQTLIDEINTIQQRGISLTDRLWISPRCHLVMPYHPLIEAIYEEAKGDARTGTTRRGMGPVYADKVSYNGIRLFDLADREILADKLRLQLEVKNRILTAFDLEPLEAAPLLDRLIEQFSFIRPFVLEPFGLLQDALRDGKHILLEGAQGTMLDNVWGTYPFCTASETLAGGASAGMGIPPGAMTRVIGVAKAYTSRVGAGPMPTELTDDTGEKLRTEGNEYGTVTGRPRRCGWFDAEVVRFACQVNGVTELALTKLDVLDKLPVIKIATGYREPGMVQPSHYWEGDAGWLETCSPVYEEMPGWQSSTRIERSFQDLPHLARAYISRIEELVGVPVKILSVGPGRDDTILI